MEDSSYAPRSPDLSAFDSDAAEPEPLHPQHQKYRGSVSLPPPPSPYAPPAHFLPSQSTPMPTRAARVKAEADEDDEWSPHSARKKVKTESREPGDPMDASNGAIRSDASELAPGVVEGIEVKTKFPAARIKRIMQADEDVGKVAQVTPHVVAKALELFMISLVTKAATEAKNRSSKRVSAAHLKQAVLKEEHFDFLNDIVNKVSDAPAPADRGGSPEEAEGKKRKAGRKKRKDSDDL